MSHSNPKNPPKPEHELEIHALTYGPYGIGRVNGKALMVPHTAPGDRVAARVVQAKERYAIGELLRVIRPAPARQTPPCPYVGRCGGCSWQHLRYEAQLDAKQRSVEDALRRIGKFTNFDLRRIVPSPSEYHYRRRIRLQLGQHNRLGFYGAASHDLVEIASCDIAASPLNRTLEPLHRWLADLRSDLAYVELVVGDAPAEIVAVAQAVGSVAPIDGSACEALVDSKAINGLVVASQSSRSIWGKPWITVVIEDDLALKLDADVFTQVNPEANRQMLKQLLSWANFHAGDRILELYSGAGNFTLPIARRVERVTAVEGSRSALTNGKLNAQRYKIENIDWLAADVPQALAQLQRQRRRFTKIVLDPPRAGAKDADEDLSMLGAETIAYISCNPTTLARDLAALTKRGYKLEIVQPMDFFPHTFHVETLALLTR